MQRLGDDGSLVNSTTIVRTIQRAECVKTSKKEYACEVCLKRFKMKSVLVVHRRTHTGEKPFTCKICRKSFSQRGHLTTHLKIHIPDKPFVCSLCGRGFRQKHHLKDHYLSSSHNSKLQSSSFQTNG